MTPTSTRRDGLGEPTSGHCRITRLRVHSNTIVTQVPLRYSSFGLVLMVGTANAETKVFSGEIFSVPTPATFLFGEMRYIMNICSQKISIYRYNQKGRIPGSRQNIQDYVLTYTRF